MSVIEVRLVNLQQHLQTAQNSSAWLTKLAPCGGVSDNLWEFAFTQIHDEADELDSEIADLRDRMRAGTSDQEAWAEYQNIRARSENVLRECLNVLGGLALRDRATDDQICQLADDLIYECAQPTFRVVATVPTLGEPGDSLTTTLRRVASVRFPDWSLWTVPLVAYEYAFVMTEVEDVLRHYVTNQASGAVARDNRGLDPGEAQARAESCARVLLADAFATFTMGPGYAAPALLLRLDPSAAGHRFRPSDALRAKMILGVLAAMDNEAMGAYQDVRTFLSRQWQGLVDVGPPPGDLEAFADVLLPDSVARYLARKFKFKRTGYSATGWSEARGWARTWNQMVRDQQPLRAPDTVSPSHSLRDAMNAAWDSRIWITQNLPEREQRAAIDDVVRADRELCERLVQHRRETTGTPVPRSSRPTAPGVN